MSSTGSTGGSAPLPTYTPPPALEDNAAVANAEQAGEAAVIPGQAAVEEAATNGAQAQKSTYEKAPAGGQGKNTLGNSMDLASADQAERVKNQGASQDVKTNFEVSAAMKNALRETIKGAMASIAANQALKVNTSGLEGDAKVKADAANAKIDNQIEASFKTIDNTYGQLEKIKPETCPQRSAFARFLEDMREGRKGDDSAPGLKKPQQKPLSQQTVTTGLNTAQAVMDSSVLANVQAANMAASQTQFDKHAAQQEEEAGGVSVGGGNL